MNVEEAIRLYGADTYRKQYTEFYNLKI
jgi:hypothetical protein